jgi:hypothetical protein
LAKTSTLQLKLVEAFKRMPSLRRFIGSRLVYTPLLAIVIFLVVMAIILGVRKLQRSEKRVSTDTQTALSKYARAN